MGELLVFDMTFAKRLAALRKARSLTQQSLAELVGVRVLQIHRYESGSSQPTLDVIRKLSIALNVTSDELIFDRDERGPDEEFRLLFEALSRLDSREKQVIKELLEGMLLRHEAKKWTANG